MTPKEQADILADKCTDAIIEAPKAKLTQDIIRDTCCLVEFFEVVEAIENPVRANQCADALDALRAKLPKEVL